MRTLFKVIVIPARLLPHNHYPDSFRIITCYTYTRSYADGKSFMNLVLFDDFYFLFFIYVNFVDFIRQENIHIQQIFK